MDDILVSVVIPTYNGYKTLKRAIDSVREQTYSHIELIIVDDNYIGSKEQNETEKILERYRHEANIQYIKQKKKSNGSAARNIGVNNARGKYIFFLDDDDYYLPERIEKCVHALEQSGKEVAFTDVEYYYNNKCYGQLKVRLDSDCFFQTLMNDSVIGTGSNIVIRKDVYLKAGGFDEKLSRLQDYDFLLNLFSKGICPQVINEIMVRKYRYDRNIPSYKEYRKLFEYVYSKYNVLIDKYSDIDKRKIEYHLHKTLYRMAIYNKDIEGVKYEKSFIKGSMGVNECIREMFVYIPATQFFRRIYYCFRYIKKRIS